MHMDGKTFDALTKGIGKECTRRTAFAGLAGALVGLGFAREAAAQVEAEACGRKGQKCFRNTDCCQGLKCKNGGDPEREGKCVFKNNSGGKGDFCRDDRDCKRRFVCRRSRCR